MAAGIKHAEVITRVAIIIVVHLGLFFVEFPSQIVELCIILARLPLYHLVLVEEAVRASRHRLRISVDQATYLVEQLAVAPDQVHIIDKLLHALIWWARLSVR